MSVFLSVLLITAIKMVISRNSMSECKGIQEPGQTANSFGPTGFQSYPTITNTEIVIQSQTYAINICNTHTHYQYSWQYTCINVDNIVMEVFDGDDKCNATGASNSYSYTFTSAERTFNCDENAADCVLSYDWVNNAAAPTGCDLSGSPFARINIVSGGCSPDYTTWGSFDNGLYLGSVCSTQNTNNYKQGWFLDEDCTLGVDVNNGGNCGYEDVNVGSCDPQHLDGPGIQAFTCSDANAYDEAPICGESSDPVDQYYCANTGESAIGCDSNGQCESCENCNMPKPGYRCCSSESDGDLYCSNIIGLDFCQYSWFCVPNCKNLINGDSWCQAQPIFGDGYFCQDDGKCALEVCDVNAPECSTSGFICSTKYDNQGQMNGGECVKDCNYFGSDIWCAQQLNDDYSYKCQTSGHCDREDCDSEGLCNTPLVCNTDTHRENGECVRDCDGNSTLCQLWNEYETYANYYVCNVDGLCEIEYPTCAAVSTCEDINMGWGCDVSGTGRCYEIECAENNDCCCQQGMFCDSTVPAYDPALGVCKNYFEEKCSVVGCDWLMAGDIQLNQAEGYRYGLEYECNVQTDDCEPKNCDPTSSNDCSTDYFCFAYNENICALKCENADSSICWNVFGHNTADGWQCDTNNECVPEYLHCSNTTGECNTDIGEECMNGRCVEICSENYSYDDCSADGYFCDPNYDHGECRKSCKFFGGDDFCRQERGGDYSYICSDSGYCQREECPCNTGFICDSDGECIRDCAGNNTLCQIWNEYDLVVDYYVCNNGFCEKDFPVCTAGAAECQHIQTSYDGMGCDVDGTGKCYEIQCATDADCSKWWGGYNYPGIFCDLTYPAWYNPGLGVCKNFFDESCSLIGCDWWSNMQLQAGDGGYGIEYACNATTDRCDQKYCDSTSDCSTDYFCLVWDQHICALKCVYPNNAVCYEVFGNNADSWECDINNECIPLFHGDGGGDCNECTDIDTNECDTDKGETCVDNCCKAACTAADDCTSKYGSLAECKDGYCADNECKTAGDCEFEYFDSCFIDPTGANACYKTCQDNTDCNEIFGQDTTCETGSPCNATTDPECAEVKYCDMWELTSCVFDGCEESKACDIPSGICETISCSNDASICTTQFSEFAECVNDECRDNECLEDGDCTDRVNKCFTLDADNSNECYSGCDTNNDCEELYDQTGIECVTGDPTSTGNTIKYCEVSDITFTLNPTQKPADSPIVSTIVSTGQPTVEPTASCEDDSSLDRVDCPDEGCEEDSAYLTFDLVFSVCTIAPFKGKRVGLWNKIADCVCETAFGDDFDGTQINFGTVLERRRLLASAGSGSSTSKCDLRITQYKPDKIEWTEIEGCTIDDKDNCYKFTFVVQGCGDCTKLDNLVDAFNGQGDETVKALVKECADAIGKDEITDGFGHVKVNNFKHAFSNQYKCITNTSGVASNVYKALFVIIGVMIVAFVSKL